MKTQIKIIGFDGDDTLWQNETIFTKAQKHFYGLLKDFAPKEAIAQQLYKNETENLALYGYGIKAFTLSMIQTAAEVSNCRVSAQTVNKILQTGKKMLQEPVVMIDGAESTLKALYKKYNLVVVTKGDLLDQERKVGKSGISKYLHHIEILSEKDRQSYRKLIKRLGIKPEEFLMVGNSLKSDVMPVLQIGGKAVYVPFFETWQHEAGGKEPSENKNFYKAKNISEIIKLLK